MSENFDAIVAAEPGTRNWVRVLFPEDIPPGYIRMAGLPPNNGDTVMVASESGEWEIPADNYTKLYNEEIRKIRKREYLQAASIEEQLEAIFEYQMGNTAKLESIVEKMKAIREAHPKS